MFARYGSIKTEKAVIAYPRNVRVPYHVPISNQYISRNKEGRNALPAGMFVSKKDGVYRFLPRSRTVAPVSGARLKVSNPYAFVPGDVLVITNPMATLAVSGVGEAGITYNNKTFKYTPAGAANATEAATMLAKYFNSIPDLNNYLEIVASGASLYFYSPVGMPLVTFTPSGTLGTTATTTALVTAVVGTIQAIDAITEEFILASNAVGTIPVGSTVGVNQDEILGIYPHSVDFTVGGVTGQNIGVVDEAKVYKLALPHYDNSLIHACPRIHAREVWS